MAKRAERSLPTPASFPFPFKPYPIQEALMRQVYEALEGGKVAVLESPTGTVGAPPRCAGATCTGRADDGAQGKSLSLACASLQWLRDHEARQTDAATAPSTPPAADGMPARTREGPWAVRLPRTRRHARLATGLQAAEQPGGPSRGGGGCTCTAGQAPSPAVAPTRREQQQRRRRRRVAQGVWVGRRRRRCRGGWGWPQRQRQ
jgi:hypothetical protein